MKLFDSRSSFLDNIAAIFFIIASGSTVFYVGHQTLTMVLFAIFGFVYMLKKRNNPQEVLTGSNLRVFLYLGLWPILNAWVLHNGSGFGSTKPLFFGLGSLLIIASSNFYFFRSLLLRWLQIILCLSIIVHFGYYYLNFPANIVQCGEGQRNISMFLFDIGFAESHRLYSIFWEPGQCQIVIFFVLSLFIDELLDTKRIWSNIKQFAILAFAIYLTESTTAYFTVIILVAILAMKSDFTKRHLYILPIMLCMVAFVGTKIYYSESVQNKFDNYGEAGKSATVRAMDNLAMINMITMSPIIGHGMDTPEYDSLSNKLDNHSASNGWLNTCAEEGIPYLLVLILSIFTCLRRFVSKVPIFWVFIILALSQSGEYALFLPINFLYLFKFGSYNFYKEYLK